VLLRSAWKKIWFLTFGLSRSLEVIGTDTNRPAIYNFLLVFSSNFVPKTHRFRDIRLQKCCDLDNRVRGPSMSFNVIGKVTIRYCACDFLLTFCIVTMALSRVVSEIFMVEKCRDLEICVKCHSRSLKVVPFDRLCMISY